MMNAHWITGTILVANHSRRRPPSVMTPAGQPIANPTHAHPANADAAGEDQQE
jgi:hypothetical protein